MIEEMKGLLQDSVSWLELADPEDPDMNYDALSELIEKSKACIALAEKEQGKVLVGTICEVCPSDDKPDAWGEVVCCSKKLIPFIGQTVHVTVSLPVGKKAVKEIESWLGRPVRKQCDYGKPDIPCVASDSTCPESEDEDAE